MYLTVLVGSRDFTYAMVVHLIPRASTVRFKITRYPRAPRNEIKRDRIRAGLVSPSITNTNHKLDIPVSGVKVWLPDGNSALPCYNYSTIRD